MNFDHLCSITERHFPELVATIEKAHLFLFPGRAHEILPKEVTEEQRDFLQHSFFLPFPTVAVEDTASCIVIWDETKNSIGINQKRMFIECFNIFADIAEFREGTEEQRAKEFREQSERLKQEGLPRDAYIFTHGVVENVEAEDNRILRCRGYINGVCLANKSRIFATMKELASGPEKMRFLSESCLRNAMCALEEVCYFNTPDRFVVEVSDVKPQRQHNKKLVRSHERPTYILLKAKEIREKMRLPPASEGGGVRVHERRAHYRYLTSIRYTEKRFQNIFIPAMWVGTSTAIVGKKMYKVRLDI